MLKKATGVALSNRALFFGSSKSAAEVLNNGVEAVYGGAQSANMAVQAASGNAARKAVVSNSPTTGNLFSNVNNAATVLSQRETFKRFIATSTPQSGAASTLPVTQEDVFATPLRYLHWIMAGGIMSVILLVQLARNTEDKTAKGNYMMLHKSIGFTLGFFAAARIFYRLTTPLPKMLDGPVWEQYAAAAVHYGFYGLMVYMPFSGVVMGYYGGKGVPFFGYTIPGASKENQNGDYAKTAFKTHKWAGQVFYYILPLHVGAAFFHHFKGQQIFARVNPLLKLSSA